MQPPAAAPRPSLARGSGAASSWTATKSEMPTLRHAQRERGSTEDVEECCSEVRVVMWVVKVSSGVIICLEGRTPAAASRLALAAAENLAQAALLLRGLSAAGTHGSRDGACEQAGLCGSRSGCGRLAASCQAARRLGAAAFARGALALRRARAARRGGCRRGGRRLRLSSGHLRGVGASKLERWRPCSPRAGWRRRGCSQSCVGLGALTGGRHMLRDPRRGIDLRVERQRRHLFARARSTHRRAAHLRDRRKCRVRGRWVGTVGASSGVGRGCCGVVKRDRLAVSRASARSCKRPADGRRVRVCRAIAVAARRAIEAHRAGRPILRNIVSVVRI